MILSLIWSCFLQWLSPLQWLWLPLSWYFNFCFSCCTWEGQEATHSISFIISSPSHYRCHSSSLEDDSSLQCILSWASKMSSLGVIPCANSNTYSRRVAPDSPQISYELLWITSEASLKLTSQALDLLVRLIEPLNWDLSNWPSILLMGQTLPGHVQRCSTTSMPLHLSLAPLSILASSTFSVIS